MLDLVVRTLALAAGVLALSTLVALPAAYLTTRTDLPGRRIFTVLQVLPLAIPGYVLAYLLQSTGGLQGPVYRFTGLLFERPHGYWGALVVLAIYNTPYLYLNLRTAFERLDPDLEDAARSLGSGRRRIFSGVVLPQIVPGYLAGALLVLLHVLGDFGVVSLMRYDTFSRAIFLEHQFPSAGYTRAAWLALLLLAMTAPVLLLEWRALRDLRLYRAGRGSGRRRRQHRLGGLKAPALALLSLHALVSLALPVGTLVFWAFRGSGGGALRGDWLSALLASVQASLPAALIATFLALHLAYLSSRYPSRWSQGIERTAYLGYATPPVAFGLALVVLFVRSDLYEVLSESLVLLVGGYSIHFLAEALGPLRSALSLATPRFEEASRSLGRGPLGTFAHVTFPLLRTALGASAAFVFLSAMKELPMTMLLAPRDFDTLAKVVYDRASEISYADAAPYALTILVTSALFVGLLFVRREEPRD